MIKLLLRIGLVRRRDNGTIRWPLHVMPWWIWRVRAMREGHRAGWFRNLPGVVKWEKERLLPRRWGFFFLGLEVGDRG